MCNTEVIPDTTIASQTTIVEKHSLAEILPAHTKDPKNSRIFSATSSNQQPTIPTFACEVASCTRTFNKQYELKSVSPYPFPMRNANRL
jgi:hypothetical protein